MSRDCRTDRLLPLMHKYATSNELVDMQDVLETFGFDNICRISFGEDPGCLLSKEPAEGEEFMRAFKDTLNLLATRFMSITWKIKKLINIGSEKKLKESTKIVHDIAMKIIKTRKARTVRTREEEDEEEDLLSRLMTNKNNTGELLRDNAISLILAGRETTSSALTWFFWLLLSRPDVEKVIFMRSSRFARRAKTLTRHSVFDELREINLVHASISESLRLYPLVAFDTQSNCQISSM